MEEKNERRAADAVALPFRTFAEIEALGLEVHVRCSGCRSMRLALLGAAHRDRLFAGARLVCKRLVPARFGDWRVVCNGIGHLSIRPSETFNPARATDLVTFACPRCVPPWEIGPFRSDDTLWRDVLSRRGAFYFCPACRCRLDTFWSGGSGTPFTERYRGSDQG